jgi:hypothetical protein
VLDTRLSLPRRKPRGKDRPPEHLTYSRAFAQFRIVVEQTIGQVRRFQSVTATDHNHRRQHGVCVMAVAAGCWSTDALA